MNIMARLICKVTLIIMGLTVIVASCRSERKTAAPIIAEEVLPDNIVELREDQIKLADVQLGAVEMKSISNVLKVNGTVSVAPQNLATVCMPMGGFIKNTSLIPGNAVNKGDILAVIDNQEFVDMQLAYLEAKNKLVFAEADFKRHTDLYKEDVYSEQNLQQVTVEYKNTKALVKSLQQKLILIGIDPDQLMEDNISSTVNLVSPIRGFLKTVNVNIGKYVNPTEVLFEIVNTDRLFLELTLFEKDADKVSAGQKVKFFINNETEEHEAIISQTGKSVRDDKTIVVYASVSSTCKNLLPGMYVNAFVSESDNKVSSLPSDAVVSFDDKDYIFAFDKNKKEEAGTFTEFRMVEVKKGVSDSGYTEIILPEGFDMSSKIVTRGAYTLLSAKKNAGEMAC